MRLVRVRRLGGGPRQVARSFSRASDRTADFCDFSLAPGWDPARLGLLVVPNVVTAREHDALVAEVEADETLRRRRFSDGHWDAVITGYRETQLPLSTSSALLRSVATRVQAHFGPGAGSPMSHVHALELSPTGRIDAHVDSIKFSGGVVAVVSLCSDAVLVLRHAPSGDGGAPVAAADAATVSVLAPAQSLYVLRGESRYRWSHAIAAGATTLSLPASHASSGGVRVEVRRGRRISLVFRDELLPEAEQQQSMGQGLAAQAGYGGAHDAGGEKLVTRDGGDPLPSGMRRGRLSEDGSLEEF